MKYTILYDWHNLTTGACDENRKLEVDDAADRYDAAMKAEMLLAVKSRDARTNLGSDWKGDITRLVEHD